MENNKRMCGGLSLLEPESYLLQEAAELERQRKSQVTDNKTSQDVKAEDTKRDSHQKAEETKRDSHQKMDEEASQGSFDDDLMFQMDDCDLDSSEKGDAGSSPNSAFSSPDAAAFRPVSHQTGHSF